MSPTRRVVDSARDTILRKHPGLDTIVTMSGVMLLEDLRDPAHFSDAMKVIDTNLVGTIRLIDAFTPHLIERGSGTIVTVTSGIAFLPVPADAHVRRLEGRRARLLRGPARATGRHGRRVAELVPPAVATSRNTRQPNPRALKLDAFATEVMDLLRTDPTPHEILVKGVQMHRWAEREGTYDESGRPAVAGPRDASRPSVENRRPRIRSGPGSRSCA